MDPSIRIRFKQAREAAGLTQMDVARHFCVDKATVCRWERGETRLTLELLVSAAALFGCERSWLVFGEGKAPRESTGRPRRRKAS